MAGVHEEVLKAPKFAARFFISGAESLRDDDIRKYFSQFGEVVEANLLVDKKSKRPRGIGFCSLVLGDISDTAGFELEKEKILERDHAVKGVEIEVSEAMPDRKKKAVQTEDGNEQEEENPFFGKSAAERAAEAEAAPPEPEEDQEEALRNQKEWEMHFLQMAMMGTPNPEAGPFGPMGPMMDKGKGKGGMMKGRPGPY